MSSFGASQEGDTTFELNDQVILLQSLWRTELNAPEILPFQQETVESIKETLEAQQVCSFVVL